MAEPVLHGYFRSGASQRVRIALNLKGVAYADVFHHLRRGEQSSPEYQAINPQGLVPTLVLDGKVMTQSLAICEYLEERYPEPPLLPGDAEQRARIRAFAQVIASDTHPIQNLKILNRLRNLGLSEDAVSGWAAQIIQEGLDACETLIADQPGPFCFGRSVTLADVVLVPQLQNARRFGADLRWPRLLAAEAACGEIDAFQRARPEQQADAE